MSTDVYVRRVHLIVLPLSLSVTELHETTMMPLEEVEPRRFEFRDALDDNFVFVAQQELCEYIYSI